MGLKQLEPTEVPIGDKTFFVTPFPALKATNISGELASTVAPLLGVIAPLIDDDKSVMDLDAQDVATACLSCAQLDGDKIEHLMRKLLTTGNVVVEETDEDGEKIGTKMNSDVADEVFCGEVDQMFMLAFEVVKLNFSGFLKRLSSQSGSQKSTEKKAKRTVL